MAEVEIRDNNIWPNHIEGGTSLRERIKALSPGETIDLEVDGIVGAWEKTRIGKDGRAQQAIKPIGSMKKVWERLQARRGQFVLIREVQTADSYLRAASGVMADEWSSPEDEEAFGDL